MARAWCIVAAFVTLAAGCSSPAPAPDHPGALRVATPIFALAEVTRRVGLDRVVVSDGAGVAIDLGTRPWVDPVAMEQVTELVASFLIMHDPAGRAAYQSAARAYDAQLGALDIDYRSSLADCGRHAIVTADGAFQPLAARYGFVDRSAADAGVAQLVTAQRIRVLFTEPGVATDQIEALAQATHTKVDQLDPTKVRTPEEAARGATYLSLMTDNLAKLRAALACTASS